MRTKRLERLKDPVTCVVCRRVDQNEEPNYVGTSKTMRCRDCAGPNGRASKCRDCCPTGHGVKYMEKL